MDLKHLTTTIFFYFFLIFTDSLVECDDRVVSWNIGSFIHPVNKSVKFDIKIFSPTIPGTYQVIVYLPGLEGMVPTFLYADFCTQLVISSQSIIISFDAFRFPHLPDVMEEFFEVTLNWTLSNVREMFDSKKTPEIIKGLVHPDLNSTDGVSIMSHSAGAHGVALYLVKNCGKVKSLILLDPVDGYDPFGIVKIFVTHPPAKLNVTIPTLIAASGLSSQHESVMPACAPQNISNNRFYDSLAGPTWFLNFTQYGHADILDDPIREYFIKFLCKSCHGDCNYDLYRKTLANSIAYFLNGLKKRSNYFLSAIESPMNSTLFNHSIVIDSKFNLNGYDVTRTGPFCFNK